MPTADGLYYEEAGEGEPLLMVMGLGTDHLGWMLQVPEFSKHYRVITFDNRDVGQSKQADGPYEIADMARDALALADHLELDTFHLLGMSLGGAIAQEMALLAPERLRTLTLVVTFAGGGDWAAERARLWSEIRGLIDRDTHLDWLLLFGMSEDFYASPERVEYSKQLMRANPHPQSTEAFQRQVAAGGRHETRDRLAQISVPTHVIGAERDTLVPVWKSKEIADLIPGADYAVMQGAPARAEHGARGGVQRDGARLATGAQRRRFRQRFQSIGPAVSTWLPSDRPEDGLRRARRLDELLEVDPRLVAHLVEHRDEVLGRDVAGGPGRDRAPAQLAERRLERAHAGVERGQDVGEARPARVVEVGGQLRPLQPVVRRGEELAHLDAGSPCRSCRRRRSPRSPRRSAARRCRRRARAGPRPRTGSRS